jgi:hypothetical protein
VDQALRGWFGPCLPRGAVVSTDSPTAEWAHAARKAATVNLFLYDVREDLTGRGADWDDIRDERGRVVARQPPPRRYELSYLVTAWGASADAEHELLGAVLAQAASRDVLPDDCLPPGWPAARAPLVVRSAPPQPVVEPGDLWSGLGIPPRAAVNLVVTAPLIPARIDELEPLAERLDLGLEVEA